VKEFKDSHLTAYEEVLEKNMDSIYKIPDGVANLDIIGPFKAMQSSRMQR